MECRKDYDVELFLEVVDKIALEAHKMFSLIPRRNLFLSRSHLDGFELVEIKIRSNTRLCIRCHSLFGKHNPRCDSFQLNDFMMYIRSFGPCLLDNDLYWYDLKDRSVLIENVNQALLHYLNWKEYSTGNEEFGMEDKL